MFSFFNDHVVLEGMEDGICVQFMFNLVSFLCAKHSALICLNLNFKCILSMPSSHSFKNMLNLCRCHVKMAVELRNKTSAVEYFKVPDILLSYLK